MSPYKDKTTQKAAVAKAVRKLRSGITDKGITKPATRGDNVIPYHPVLEHLIPGKKREKMEAIVLSLKKHRVLEHVTYGMGKYPVPMTEVGELLEATR